MADFAQTLPIHAPMAQSLHALVDYFNVASLPTHRRPTFADHDGALHEVVSTLVDHARSLNPRPETLRVRLYGGWHDERTEGPTQAREVLGAIARRHYPAGRHPCRVFVGMADSLMALRHHDLRHTLRLWNGLPPLRIRRPDSCTQPGECPLDDFRHWQKNRCPRHSDCPVATRDAIATERQKLVDTAIVADTIHLARYDRSSWVAVVSNDDDILPGLLSGAAEHERLMLVTVARTQPSAYAELLSRMAVAYAALKTHP